MKILIVEDDFVGRLLLQEILKDYGTTHLAVNGEEAVHGVRMALEAGEPYDLICLDIMMPEMDGQTALKHIRALEEENGIVSSHGAKIIMVTAVTDTRTVMDAFFELCDGYLFKPIDKAALLHEMEKLGLRALH